MQLLQRIIKSIKTVFGFHPAASSDLSASAVLIPAADVAAETITEVEHFRM